MISVICPIFNKEIYLEDTILSVLNQTVGEWELLLVDDGSTDSSGEIARKYSKLHSNIFYYERNKIKEKIKGANVCRNIGAQLAKGDYLLFLDADDYLLPVCIEERIKEISDFPDFDFYVFRVAYVKGMPPLVIDNKNFSSQLLNLTKSNPKIVQDFCLKKFLKFDLLWHTSSGVWKKELFSRIYGFNENYQRLQDPEIHSKLLLEENLKIKFFQSEIISSIHHRIDDDRKVWSHETFFNKQLSSVIIYVNDFYRRLSINNFKEKVSLLQGYLLFAEMLVYDLRKSGVSHSESEVYLRDFYKEIPQEIIDWKYKFVRYIISKLSKNSYFLKKRIPGGVVYLFKKTLK